MQLGNQLFRFTTGRSDRLRGGWDERQSQMVGGESPVRVEQLDRFLAGDTGAGNAAADASSARNEDTSLSGSSVNAKSPACPVCLARFSMACNASDSA
ncbi:hypothetical protein ACIHAX_20750 [Nocardia sp. NPDC051929]|uniref:hypothetical protein n=1 Tax=Nocardia sp. NPDC051929 TaxID=3364327 RepID=UPI0037C934D6